MLVQLVLLCLFVLSANKERNISAKQDQMNGRYLGPEFNENEIEVELNKDIGAVFSKLSEEKLIEQVADGLAGKL